MFQQAEYRQSSIFVVDRNRVNKGYNKYTKEEYNFQK